MPPGAGGRPRTVRSGARSRHGGAAGATMTTAGDLLELIGQAVLPALASPSAEVSVAQVARDAWPAWTRLDGSALHELAALAGDPPAAARAAAEASRRL